MLFIDFAKTLKQLEDTPKRLEITDILAKLIAELDDTEVDKAVYLLLGQLKAPFESQKFNIAEKMMLKILHAAFPQPGGKDRLKEIEAMYQQQGDLGNVAFDLAKTKTKSNLSITSVYDKLTEIAQSSGSGSQDTKITKAGNLLAQLDAISAKYVVRIILGITRLGFTELTIIDALAKNLGDKTLKKQLEQVYTTHPDIGLITKNLKLYGIQGVDKITIETGVPILSQKPQRMASSEEAIEKMILVWAEYKFDGTRVQLHMDRNKPSSSTESDQSGLFNYDSNDFLIKTYTRNLEDTTHQYPDLIDAAAKQIKADSVILDGEAIGFDKKTGEFLPFQETIQRKRKHQVKEAIANIPLKYFVFDILYLNGKSLTHLSLRERKAKLKEIVKDGDTISVDYYLETNDALKLQEFYETAKQKKLEGLVVKNPEDPYQAGARSYSWVKIKRADEMLLSDSVDCVVLGYYAGRGARSKFGIGGFLAGVLDKKTQTFKTITKVGTGLTDEEWAKLKTMCDAVKTAKIPANVEMDKIYTPDVIVLPKVVVELGADEISESPTHSAGYALRFPRLIKFRSDKGPTDITDTNEIKDMFKKQKAPK